MPLDVVDHRQDPQAWARQLGVSREAVDLLLDSDFIDLHLDLEVPVRVKGTTPPGATARPVDRLRCGDTPTCPASSRAD